VPVRLEDVDERLYEAIGVGRPQPVGVATDQQVQCKGVDATGLLIHVAAPCVDDGLDQTTGVLDAHAGGDVVVVGV